MNLKKVKHVFIDFSSLDLYRSCPRKFQLQLIEGLIPSTEVDESATTTFKGTLIHAALDAHGRGKNAFAAMDALLEQPGIKAIKEIQSDKSGSIAHMRELLESYLTHYDGDGLKVLLSEQRLEVPLAPWLTYVGNVDKVVMNEKGEILILDHKTSSSLKSWVEPQVALSDQFTGYLALALANGTTASGLIVDGISTAKKALLDGDGLFVRYTASRTSDQLADWAKRTVAWASRLREDIESGAFNTNQPKNCTAFNGRCPFFDTCASGSASAFANSLKNSFIKNPKPWHSMKVVYE